MPRRDRRVLVALTLLSSLCLLAEAAGVLAPTLLYAAPLLLVALPLIAGTLRALRSIPRGGRLIADSLAVRPPPAAAFGN